MLIVHFYDNTEKVYSVYANSLEDVKKNPKAYFPEVTENTIITLENFKYPILEKGILREMTREELIENEVSIELEEGEKIENKKLIKFEKPSEYHSWNGEEWIADLQRAKKEKRNELKEIRNQKIEENIEVHGSVFQVRNSDKENFDDVELMMRTGEIDENYKKNWVLADNSIKGFTAQQIIDVWKERTKRKDRIFQEFGALSIKLEKCNSVEKVQKITWE
ncbi:DUF4376 domain-containing protein [Fusobacterium necrophorum]|uniref:DUF4376 domain-containing protein n=1 Tax=Fusobacterium necrophorum TaxID=859 RepID=UPI00255116B2|nr:DUF4376 domain-containing protein [Fusobacterium necrophorum]MDK4498430.1 DUF4376 domain-containing protein [Fusobacterium necrophorum]